MLFAQRVVAQTTRSTGSPHLFLADGTNAQDPGIEADWEEGSDGFWRPTIVADDPSAYDDCCGGRAA